MSFLDLSSLGLVSTVQQLLADWLTYMQTAYPGYVPAPADLEYIHAQAIAAIASDVAQTAVVVPDAIFRQFGTQLAGIAYMQGLPAMASVQVTAVDDTGYTLDEGTGVTLGIYGFTTVSDLVIPNGQTVGTVTVVAAAPLSIYNGATNPTELQVIVDWVASTTALGPASGGVDPEDDSAYQDRLAALLQLQAPRPITASDYATMSLSFTPAAGTDQQEIGRATSIDGYLEGSAAFTVSENSTDTLTVTAAPGTGITAAQGATITGSGIPANTLVVSSSSGSIVMSQAASATTTGVTATVGGTLGNERTVTTCVTLADGTATNSDTKTALQAWLESYRELNFVAAVIDPTYTEIYVDVSAHLYPGFNTTSTQAAIQAALVSFLSPQNSGLPPYGDVTAWLSSTVVRYDKLIGVIQGVPGVDYVVNGSLTLGTAPSPSGTSDLTIQGPCALPTSTVSTVNVTIV